MSRIEIHTDGGCYPNPGKGAWSIVLSKIEFYRGQKKMTTNNEMELMAIRNAMLYTKKYKPDYQLKIISDSKYCVDGFNSWMENWKKKDWKKRKGAIANLDLWKEVYRIKHSMIKTPELEWVKGHSGNPLNELADELATYKD